MIVSPKSLRAIARASSCLNILSLCACSLALSSCGRCGFGTYYTNGVRKYSGDGVISDASQPSGLFGSRGYIIDFPKFDLGEKYRATYHLSGTPTLGSAKAEIVLLIDEPAGFSASRADQFKDAAIGNLRCSLADSSGRLITHFETPLRDLIWSSPIHDRSGYALYDLDRSLFIPDSSANYTLTIDYSGDTKLAGRKGAVYVWCGCGGS